MTIIDCGSFILRPLRAEDAEALAKMYNNSKISVNLRDRFPHPYTLTDAQKFISLVSHQNPVAVFCIEKDDAPVGTIALRVLEDVYRKSAELGYSLGEDYWGQGIATKAVKHVVKYGFDTLDIVRIQSCVFEHNIASMRVLEKVGFIREGIGSKAVFKNGQFLDEHRYRLLKEDVV